MQFLSFIRGSVVDNSVSFGSSFKVSELNYTINNDSGLVVFNLKDVSNSLLQNLQNLGWKFTKKVNNDVVDLMFFGMSDRDAVRFLSDLYRDLEA